MFLDDRWGTGYWAGDGAPASPQGLSEACERRAAWLVVSGYADEHDDDDRDTDDSFLSRRAVHLCGWCRLDEEMPVPDEPSLQRALAGARNKSVAWRWS